MDMTPKRPSGSEHVSNESRELIHSLRNCLFALQAGMQALESAEDRAEVSMVHAAMHRQLEALASLIDQTCQMLEHKQNLSG
jgi:hypothetical protein